MSAILKPMPQETRCPQCGMRAASIVCHTCKTNKIKNGADDPGWGEEKEEEIRAEARFPTMQPEEEEHA